MGLNYYTPDVISELCELSVLFLVPAFYLFQRDCGEWPVVSGTLTEMWQASSKIRLVGLEYGYPRTSTITDSETMDLKSPTIVAL